MYLVRSESDFYIAQEPSLHLVPTGITWEQFCIFAANLARISERDVSTRYTYGEIRLTRLNFYAPFLLGKSNFQRVEYQYSEYFAHFYGPVLFVIGITSTILTGLQVAIAVQAAEPALGGQVLLVVSRWSSVTIILCFCLVVIFLFSLLIYKVIKEWKYAIRDRLRFLEEGQKEMAK
jgi:hypothetical protein